MKKFKSIYFTECPFDVKDEDWLGLGISTAEFV